MDRLSRTKAIRMKCLDCSGGQQAEVRKCPATNCPLWRYRMGREENDELKPVRKNSEKLDDFEDEDLE
jgi:hypothetical protein